MKENGIRLAIHYIKHKVQHKDPQGKKRGRQRKPDYVSIKVHKFV
jgi:hypothetical protein